MSQLCLTQVARLILLGEFQILDHTYDIHQSDNILGTASENTRYTAGQKFQCSHVSCKSGNTKSAHNSEFLSLFEINSDLSSQQKQNVEKLLIENKALFVTPGYPDLGLTDLVEYKIHLKPGMTPKHQRPYKLAPDKREVLRHQLDELFHQGIIAPVSEKEDIPISSPIVLVSKRNKPNQGLNLDPLRQVCQCIGFAWIFATSIRKLRNFAMLFPMYMS